MMIERRNLVLTNLLLLVVVGVGALLFAAVRLELAIELLYVAMLLLGMLAMAALSIVQKLIEPSTGTTMVQINFNEARTRESLREVVDAEVVEVRDRMRFTEAPWEPSPEALLSADPALALAKLRIDLERELRRLVYEHKLDIDPQRASIGRLIEVLLREDIVPPQAVAALQDILPPMNEAVHGGQVEQSVANSVVAIGADVLALLRTAARRS
jgi:hypothetical protein